MTAAEHAAVEAPVVDDVIAPSDAVEKAVTVPDADELEADADTAPGDLATSDAPPAAADDQVGVAAETAAPEPETAPPSEPATPAMAATDEVAPVPTPPPHRGRALNDPRERRKAAARTSTSDAQAD